MAKVTKKFNNFEYAPGISSYGINGKDGKSGESGTSLFICRYDVTDTDGIVQFGKAIVNNLDMTKNDGIKLARAYKNGDTFLMQSTGQLYKIIDIENLKYSSVNNQLDSETLLNEYLELVGEIEMTSIDTGFKENKGRLVLDTEAYKGFIINTTNNENVNNIKAPLTIISTTTDNNNNIYFLSLTGINQQSNTDMKIYYNTDNKCYHIESDSPVLIDADLKVKYNDSDDFDSYSRVVTATDNVDMSLSSMYALCKKLDCVLDMTTVTENNIKKTKFEMKFTNIPDNCNMSDVAVHIIITDNNTGSVVKDAYFSPVTISSDSYKNKVYDIYADELNYTSDEVKKYLNARVSVINTVECYISSTINKK